MRESLPARTLAAGMQGEHADSRQPGWLCMRMPGLQQGLRRLLQLRPMLMHWPPHTLAGVCGAVPGCQIQAGAGAGGAVGSIIERA